MSGVEPLKAQERLAVVTPIWRASLTNLEATLLRRTSVAAAGVNRLLLAPDDLALDYYRQEFPDWIVRTGDPRHFASVDAYSAFLLDPDFYRLFDDFDAIVLCQVDAVLLKDPRPLARIDADYLGAPWASPIRVIWWRRTWLHHRRLYRWLGRRLTVGNGGLSLRRPAAFIRFTTSLANRRDYPYLQQYNEDMVVSYFGRRYGLRIASAEQAATCFMETTMQGLDRMPDVIGMHGMERFNPRLLQAILDGEADERATDGQPTDQR